MAAVILLGLILCDACGTVCRVRAVAEACLLCALLRPGPAFPKDPRAGVLICGQATLFLSAFWATVAETSVTDPRAALLL